MNARWRLDGKIALITGASRGIGLATARELAALGADVLMVARDAEVLEARRGEMEALYPKQRVLAFAADLAEAEQRLDLFDWINDLGRGLDIVVNNVGGTMPGPLMYTSPQDLKDAFTFNVATAHALTQAAVPLMLEHAGGGSVINITSAVGRLAGRGFAAYGTAKAALAHYTKLAAMDLCPKIRVNGIAPGSILTSALDIVASNEALRDPMEKATPMRRLGDPEDIAAAALYLASPAGAYVTGKVLEVDGGLTFPNLDLPIPDL